MKPIKPNLFDFAYQFHELVAQVLWVCESL